MRATLILTLTLKDGDSEATLIEKTQEYINYSQKQLKDEGYTIVRASVGIHKDATRLHTHMTTVLDIPDHKIVKYFNKKFEKLLLNTDDRFELRRTLWKDDNPKYDERRGLAYNLKEYENFDQVLLLPSFVGLTNEEIEEMRIYAHDEWKKAKAENDRNAKRKQFEEDERSNIFQYIDDFISPKNRQVMTKYFRFDSVTTKQQVDLVKVAVMQYYEDRYNETGKSGFKAYSVKDIAINYVVCKNLVSKMEMVTLGII